MIKIIGCRVRISTIHEARCLRVNHLQPGWNIISSQQDCPAKRFSKGIMAISATIDAMPIITKIE